MDFFSFLTIIGGLSFFLYGMHVMSTGLERMAGGQLEIALKKMTSNMVMSLLLGAGITVAVQSSSAVTVMLVGLVNSGIMEIGQTVGVIIGTNIGKAIPTWMFSLIAIDSSNFFLRMLKPDNFSLIFSLIGILLVLGGKKPKHKDIGSILVGFAVLMYGMKLMSDSVKPLADMPEFASILTAFENPILGVLVGALFTGIIQSSAASIGMLQALSLTGSITFGMAIPIIMGQNIGTCVTALLSAIGVSRNARKVAVIHISFNIIGTIFFTTVYLFVTNFFEIAMLNSPINAYNISLWHTLFNIATMVLLLPFSRYLVKLANLICDRKSSKTPASQVLTADLIDNRLLATPSVAISECNTIINRMAVIARESLESSYQIIRHYNPESAQVVKEHENTLDRYEDRMGTFLVQISAKALSEEDSQRVSKMLHAIGDFERLGDHALNLLDAAKELADKSLTFSEPAWHELDVLSAATSEIIALAVDAYIENDAEKATLVEPLEQTIDHLVQSIRTNHIARLKAGNCSIELGFILADMLVNFERISDHCSNIAATTIEISHNALDTHKYLNGVKYGNNTFNDKFDEYTQKYSLV